MNPAICACGRRTVLYDISMQTSPVCMHITCGMDIVQNYKPHNNLQAIHINMHGGMHFLKISFTHAAYETLLLFLCRPKVKKPPEG